MKFQLHYPFMTMTRVLTYVYWYMYFLKNHILTDFCEGLKNCLELSARQEQNLNNIV